MTLNDSGLTKMCNRWTSSTTSWRKIVLQLMLHDHLCGMAESNDNMECDSFIKDCIYRDQAHVSCRNLTAHLDKLNPKWGTAGQAFKHDQKGTKEVALKNQLCSNMFVRELSRLQKNA